MSPKFLVPIVRSAASPLFFVPSAGATVFSLIHVARAFGRSFQAFELSEIPSGGGALTIEHVTGLCVERIRGEQSAGPYVLGGHCWGGILAFEIASRLEALGAKVASLTLIEAVPPRRDHEATGADGTSPELERAVSDLCDQVREKLLGLPPKLAERFGPISWRLIELALGYRSSSKLEAPIFLIRTPTHPSSVFQHWGELTTGGLEEVVMPGDAFSLLALPAAAGVGARLNENVLRTAEFR